ncbi:hypothetical protein [Saccharibacillus brassicae]|uniref:Uncharacterized protein n=1 Tax=Saccharibacillus brassicae TaxID=2583377 RepID=A0A4Y6UY88_SACBS|nr:hypothetical protein [Saccharibacillus brassicae]QDH21488.1 hypothetical protein FFV09_11955 [Saccharibacillus brassicae]
MSVMDSTFLRMQDIGPEAPAAGAGTLDSVSRFMSRIVVLPALSVKRAEREKKPYRPFERFLFKLEMLMIDITPFYEV